MVLIASGIRRNSELAIFLGESRQMVNKHVQSLKSKGFLELTPDPESGRSKIIMFAEDGKNLLAESYTLLEKIERSVAEITGQAALKTLKTALAKDWGSPPVFSSNE